MHVPPLRSRPADILLLAEQFLRQYERSYGHSGLFLTEEVSSILLRHSWPGNVRELKNLIERAVIFCEGGAIRRAHLAPQYRGNIDGADVKLGDKFAASARQIIEETITQAGGSKSEAARILHIDRKTLYNRMKKLDMG